MHSEHSPVAFHSLRLQCLQSCSMAPGHLSCSQHFSWRSLQAQCPAPPCAGLCSRAATLAAGPGAAAIRAPPACVQFVEQWRPAIISHPTEPLLPQCRQIVLQLVRQASSGTPPHPHNWKSDAAPDACILYSSAGQQPTLPNGPLELPLSPSRLAWPPGDRTPWWRPLAPGSCGLPRLPLPGDDSPGEPGRESSPRACPAGAMPPAGSQHHVRSSTSFEGVWVLVALTWVLPGLDEIDPGTTACCCLGASSRGPAGRWQDRSGTSAGWWR